MVNADGTARVCLVSGAAQGIGRAAALRIASEGGAVAVSDLPDKEKLGKELIAELKKINPNAEHTYLSLDVVSEENWKSVVDSLKKTYGRLDVLVNSGLIASICVFFCAHGIALACCGIRPGHSCGLDPPTQWFLIPLPLCYLLSLVDAGVFFHEEYVDSESLSAFRKVQQINVDGVFLGTKHCIPLMRETKSTELRSIVNLSSIAGLTGSAFPVASYHASKGAVRLFTKATALQAASQKWGIRINSVHPGLILTPLWSQGLVPGENTGDSKAMDKMVGGTANAGEAMSSMTPIGRYGTGEDVAEVIVFLASDESSFSGFLWVRGLVICC